MSETGRPTLRLSVRITALPLAAFCMEVWDRLFWLRPPVRSGLRALPTVRNRVVLRVLVAVDGSTDSTAAVHAVAARCWPAGTSMRVISVYDHGPMDTEVGIVVGPSAIGFDYEDVEDVRENASDAVAILRKAVLEAHSIVPRGRPAAAILAAAEHWASDTIFLGARGHRFIDRILIGSVSHAVASRAHFSVEVIRERR